MLAMFLSFQSLIALPIVLGSLALHGSMDVDTTLLAVANSLAMVPTVWLGSVICKQPWRRLIGFGPKSWRLLPAVGLMGLGGFLMCSEVENMTRMLLPMPKFVADIFGKMFDVTQNPFGAALALVVVAPLTEETVCRRWVLGSLLPRWKPWKAIALSGVIFGLMHMNPWQFFYASVLGFILGWLYWRTRSLWLCVFVHAFYNGTSWVFAYCQPDIPGLTSGGYDGTPQFQPWWLDAAAVTVFAGGAWLFQKQTSAPPPLMEAPPLPPIICAP